MPQQVSDSFISTTSWPAFRRSARGSSETWRVRFRWQESWYVTGGSFCASIFSEPSSTSFVTREEKSMTFAASASAFATHSVFPVLRRARANSCASAVVQVGQAETTQSTSSARSASRLSIAFCAATS